MQFIQFVSIKNIKRLINGIFVSRDILRETKKLLLFYMIYT